jgi:hypothetical protein
MLENGMQIPVFQLMRVLANGGYLVAQFIFSHKQLVAFDNPSNSGALST